MPEVILSAHAECPPPCSAESGILNGTLWEFKQGRGCKCHLPASARRERSQRNENLTPDLLCNKSQFSAQACLLFLHGARSGCDPKVSQRQEEFSEQCNTSEDPFVLGI